MTTTGELQPGWPKGGGPGRLMVVAAWFNLQLHDTIVLFIISGPLNFQLYFRPQPFQTAYISFRSNLQCCLAILESHALLK